MFVCACVCEHDCCWHYFEELRVTTRKQCRLSPEMNT